VLHRLLRQQVEARITERTVEPFHRSERVACHLLGGMRGRHAGGPTNASCATPAQQASFEQGFRACLGILRLGLEVERVSFGVRRGVSQNGKSCSEDHPQRDIPFNKLMLS
jgi:hypothetical protein